MASVRERRGAWRLQRVSIMSTRLMLLAAAAGAAGMYLWDPDTGRRRRALIRDQLARGSRLARDEVDVELRDTANRARGLLARVRGFFDRRPAGDEVIEQRVRSALGRYVSHPGAIETSVRNGVVRLEGPVLAADADRARRIARRVRGVRDVDDHLDVHAAADVPALQGKSSPVVGLRIVPATRLALGAASVAAVMVLRPRKPPTRAWLRI